MGALAHLAARLYGDRLFHLILVVAALALGAYTVVVLGVGNLFNPIVWWQSIAVWFVVAVIGHDLILFPLYTLADRLLRMRRAAPKDRRGEPQLPSTHIPLTNYLRIPTLAAGLVLLLFLPGIIEQGAPTFWSATGLTQAPYLSRWLLLTAGQTIGGFTRRAAILLPRGRSYGNGPNDFQINRTSFAAGIDPTVTGSQWRLQLLGGPEPLMLDRAALEAMPQHTVELPIACVEGWSTTQTWTGIRLADLASVAGRPKPGSAIVWSLERFGAFNHATLQTNQILNPDSLLALRVNGADLSLEHGYPARIIVPALPGVHNTKWVSSIEFRES